MAVTGPPERGPSTTLGAGTIVSRAGSPTEATEADLRALESNILTTTVGRVVSWARKNSLWPAQFGLACCAIEMIATAQARFDIARFGSEAFRASPRQADLMIVSGRVSQKMAPVVKHIYEQMLEPKWVIAMGDCASCGGVFNNYALVQGVDKLIPVDVYVAGCPPRPEALLYGFLKLQELIAEPTHRTRPENVLVQRLGEAVVEQVRFRDDLTLIVPREHMLRALEIAGSTGFRLLTDLTAVDRHPAQPRFDVIYVLTSVEQHARIRFMVHLAADQTMPSATSLWPGANWLEREVFDLFGIRFDGHPDLRRILMPDDWEGHPLRKDYPLVEEPVEFKGHTPKVPSEIIPKSKPKLL